MPKAGTTKRTIQEERQWLSDYEAGKGVHLLARDARRAPATIWRGIDRARQERDMQRVRDGILREAFTRHFQDLLLMLQSMLQQVKDRPKGGDMETLKPDIEGSTGLLMEALFNHTRRSPLGKLWKAWNLATRELHRVRTEAYNSLRELAERRIPEQWQGVVNLDGIAGSLLHALEQTPLGAQPPEFDYRKERQSDGETMRWGAWTLAVGPRLEWQAYELRELHTLLLQEAMVSEEGGRLRVTLEQRERHVNDLEYEVETLLLRRVFSGTCNLCPR